VQASRLGTSISLVLLCGCGIIAIVMALRLGLWRDGSPGPGLFPFVASVGIVSLSGLGMIGKLLGPGLAASGNRAALTLPRAALWRIGIYMLALAGYAVLLEVLGFYATTVLVLFVILKLAERLSWRLTMPLILGALLFTHLLFAWGLGVYFPRGTLWDAFS
jgi:hypothetical protein